MVGTLEEKTVSTRALAIALLKVWGIFWLVSAVTGIGNVIIEIITHPFAANELAMQRYSLFTSASSTLITLGAAIVLLRFGEMIGKSIIPAEDQVPLSLSAVDLETVLLGILGVYLMVLGFRQGAVIGYTLIRKPYWDQSGTIEFIWRNRERELAGAVVDLAAGFLLVFGKKGLAETWARLHPMSLPDTDPSSEDTRPNSP